MRQRAKRTLVALAAGLVVVTGACGTDDDNSTDASTTTADPGTTTTAAADTPTTGAAPTGGDEVTVTAADNDTSITLNAGDAVHIELENCATCGYEWREDTAPDGAVLTLVDNHLIQPDRTDGMVGGYETAVFTYRALASGTTTIELGYHAPGGDREETFTLSVTVR